jgi:hypothetical protein
MTARALPPAAWLLMALLVVWEPLTFALTLSSALPRLALFGPPAYLLAGYRAVVVALGVAAGRAMWARSPAGRRLARWWAPAHMLAVALTFATPFFPSNRVPGTKEPILLLLLTIDAAWFIWLTRSRRLRRSLGE